MRAFRLSFVMMTLLLTPSTLASSPDEPLKKSFTTDPIVVTPAREEEPLHEALRSMDAVAETRRQELQARDLPEVLAETPGVFVQRTNRGAGSPIIRGLIGPQNLILIDFVRFNTSTFRTGPNQYLALTDATAVMATEVIRGPSSVLYGNGAMGGVLHLRTFPADILAPSGFAAEGLVSARVASADQAGGGNLRLRLSSGDLGLLVSGSFDHVGDLRMGGGDTLKHAGYDAGYWQSKLVYAPGETWEISASYAGMLMRNAGRSDKFGQGELRFYDNDDHLGYLRYEARPGTTLKRVRTTLSVHRLSESVRRINCKTGGDGTVLDRVLCEAQAEETLTKRRTNDDEVTVVGAEAEANIAFLKGALTLTTGLDAYRDEVHSAGQQSKASEAWEWKDEDRGGFSEGSTYLTMGAFLRSEGNVRLTNDARLRLHGGARLSHFAAHAPDVPGLGDVDYAFSGWVFSGGMQLLAYDSINIFASFSQGFRAPNLQETTVLGDTGSKFEVPNATLLPERSDTFEIGSRGRFDHWDIQGTVFVSLLRDAIDEESATFEGQSAVDGTPVVRRVNTASGTSFGAEGRLGVEVWRLRLEASAAWMTSELQDGEGNITPARRVPPLFGAARLRYNHPVDGLYAEVGVRWAGAQRTLHPSDIKDLRICETRFHSGLLQEDCEGSAAWMSLNIRGGMQVSENVRVDASISNVLDARYTLHGSGYPAAGIDARASVTSVF